MLHMHPHTGHNCIKWLKCRSLPASSTSTGLVPLTPVRALGFSGVPTLVIMANPYLIVSCLVVANQRGLSGPVTDFHHSYTYSRDCSSSAKAGRRDSCESTSRFIGIQHSSSSPSGSSEDRRVSWCLPGGPWSALLYCAVSSKGISVRGWEKGRKFKRANILVIEIFKIWFWNVLSW